MLDELRDFIHSRIMESIGETIGFGITLPCGCCGEQRYFYVDDEEIENKCYDDIIDWFECRTELHLNHVTSWSGYGDYFSLDFSG